MVQRVQHPYPRSCVAMLVHTCLLFARTLARNGGSGGTARPCLHATRAGVGALPDLGALILDAVESIFTAQDPAWASGPKQDEPNG